MDYVPVKRYVDWVLLDEVTEIVKFSAMSLVDRLLLVNSPQKVKQMKKVEKHKHVSFSDAPKVVHF